MKGAMRGIDWWDVDLIPKFHGAGTKGHFFKL